MEENKIRLQKFLAEAKIGSRRACEELISQNLIKINGKTAVLGDKVDPKKDRVFYNGKQISFTPVPYTYIMLNKPKGYLSTAKDDRGRKTVLELIDMPEKRLYPVGRLDYQSEGLLLLTDDGEITYQLTHPKNHKEKCYEVTVSGKVAPSTLERLNQPFSLDDYVTVPAKVVILQEYPNKTSLLFTVTEGRNRQIRKMCEQTGLLIRKLCRISVGEIFLGDLPPGCWRTLTSNEIKKLKEI